MQRGRWQDVLDRPRRVPLRKAVFWIHLWSGLIVGLLATIAGVTGSAVVYREALDRRLAPALYRVSPGTALHADQLLRGAREQLPGYTFQSFDIEKGGPWVFRLLNAKGRRSAAYVDPVSGRLLGVRGELDGLMNWLYDLHTELLGGDVGTYVNGAGAAGLLLLCLTGVVVWWPGRGHLRRAVSVRVQNARRFNWDLHTAGGFWVSLPLAVQAFTGVFLCFGLAWVLPLFGGRVAEFDELVSSPKLTQACTMPGQSMDAVLRRAGALHPDAQDVFAILPADSTSSLSVFLRSAGDLRTGAVTVLAFDPCSGALLKNVDSRRASMPLRIVLWLDAFHFGLVGGNVTRAAWVPLGLAPAVLFFTGFLMWWRRVVRPQLRARTAAVSASEAMVLTSR